jgi:hypothetical protein
MKTAAEYELSYQLNVGAIDPTAGTISGATVAVSGVKALGKFVFLDGRGNLTRDEKLAVTKLPVYTDAKTLSTLMAAAQEAGGVLKIRSDHSETLQDRAGYADQFRVVENRVVADLHLNDSYRDKAIVLETAAKTPKLIGLSIDMIPSFDIEDGKALMRIDELLAVDIVDAGAITHDGLFLSRGVDKLPTVNNSPKITMADNKDKPAEPTVADCMKAIGELAAAFKALSEKKPDEAKDNVLSANLKEVSDQLSVLKTEVVSMKKEKAALGLSNGGMSPTAEEETAKALKLKADKEEAEKKNLTFSAKAEQLFKDAGGKLQRSDIKAQLMKDEPELYRSHLKALNVTR